MKRTLFTTLLAAAICAGCGDGGAPAGDLPTLDLAAAIDNPRPFDLAEIAAAVELIPLDDSDPRGLVGTPGRIAETRSGFYIAGDQGQPVKLFDRAGRFVATRGSIGRGPAEYQYVINVVADYQTDRLWVMAQNSRVAYDAAGAMVARNDSLVALGLGVAWWDGRLMVMRDPPLRFDINNGPGPAPAPDSVTTIIDLLTPDLRPESTIETKAKGTNYVLTYESVGGGIGNLRALMNYNIITGNGENLYIKEGRSDTVFLYRTGGALEPAFRLDGGKYTIPDEAYLSFNPPVDMGKFYATARLLRASRYTLVNVFGGEGPSTLPLVFDGEDAAGGFSATGPDGTPGLTLDGVPFEPVYVRDGRLVGYIQALDMVDAAEAGTLTRDDMTALAATMREDSNPVIAVIELKR